MRKNHYFGLLIIVVCICTGYAQQTENLTGVVSDTLNQPLEGANVLGQPLDDGATFKFAITDNKGRYQLELDQGADYKISVSYLGYTTQEMMFSKDKPISQYNFRLEKSSHIIEEVEISTVYRPVVVKKDTLVYDMQSFYSDSDRRVKDLLNKLPGVEVDNKGKVKVQGKDVTQLLVNGKPFMGGDTKLGVNYIPADAIDKIEMIDKYSEVGFLKGLDGSEKVAMNLELKEDKKNLIFGDLQAGGGNDKHYLLRSALFYYSPKFNASFIGDLNDIGLAAFDLEDLFRFQGGISSYSDVSKKNIVDLSALTQNTDELTHKKSQFAALNTSADLSEKLQLSTYVIFSKQFYRSQWQKNIDYIINQQYTHEQNKSISEGNNLLGLANLKLDYFASKNEKWQYNAYFELLNNGTNYNSETVTNQKKSAIQSLFDTDKMSFRQYLEWHKSYNTKHTTSMVVSHSYWNTNPEQHWKNDREFQTWASPIFPDNPYHIHQNQFQKENQLDFVFRYYWLFHPKHHLHFHIGNTFTNSKLSGNADQILNNGVAHQLSSFYNNLQYRSNDSYLGVDYQFQIGKLTNKTSVFLHNYFLDTKQPTLDYQYRLFALEPSWDSEYRFSNFEKISLKYSLQNQFPNAGQLAEGYVIKDYNRIFAGNGILHNEKFHTASLRYSKISLYRGINGFANLRYNQKLEGNRNQMLFSDNNHLSNPVGIHTPETNWNGFVSLQKKIKFVRVGINSMFSWSEYHQKINGVVTANSRSTQRYGVDLRTASNKLPTVYLAYYKGFGSYKGSSTNSVSSDSFDARLEHTLSKSFKAYINYSYLYNKNGATQQGADSQKLDFTIEYKNTSRPFGVSLTLNNILNYNSRTTNYITDYTIQEDVVYLMPRVILLSLHYNL
ncbi:MAG: carboxypeptidase-like regulatory domain-containing protein [Bacteroidota bacterium]|nr:carboxypeptidase-like regulatory domain-containing protein [Bacteroidota bacterium]